MSPLRDSTRARDLDRATTRWILDSAYAEGELGAGEYHDRIARAAAAATLRELGNLTSDLQTTTGPELRTVRRPPRALAIGAAAAVGAVLVAGVVALTVPGGESGSAATDPSSDPVELGTNADPAAPPPDPTTPIEPLTETGIDAVVTRYRFQFGDTLATSLALYPDGVRVTRPAGSAGRVEVHELAERFEPAGTEPAPPRSSALDLAEVDAKGIARLIAEAPALVGAPAGQVAHVLAANSGRPAVTVYVDDGGRTAGYVVADLTGGAAQVIRAN